MRAAVVDASVWVSRFVHQDQYHHASYRWLEHHLKEGGIVVGPAILLSEVTGPIARQTGEPALAHGVHSALLRLPGLRLVTIDRRLGESAATLAADLLLRGADAVYVALARSLSLPLVTWDEQQRARGSAVAIVSVPAS